MARAGNRGDIDYPEGQETFSNNPATPWYKNKDSVRGVGAVARSSVSNLDPVEGEWADPEQDHTPAPRQTDLMSSIPQPVHIDHTFEKLDITKSAPVREPSPEPSPRPLLEPVRIPSPSPLPPPPHSNKGKELFPNKLPQPPVPVPESSVSKDDPKVGESADPDAWDTVPETPWGKSLRCNVSTLYTDISCASW